MPHCSCGHKLILHHRSLFLKTTYYPCKYCRIPTFKALCTCGQNLNAISTNPLNLPTYPPCTCMTQSKQLFTIYRNGTWKRETP